ncbi:zinc ribbon domain-containing protein YjdM [Paracandidimonas soli]|uniref:zinc ribbon domain-containing protein YjdM n=1 Tax=Paracandidimonas soli TaxID=1917182 RepID=UPI003342CB8A
MFDLPACPQCAETDTYQDEQLYVCPHCAHEWPVQADGGESGGAPEESGREVRDSNGNVLVDGDSVILIKDLKLKGSSSTLKKGTKVKGIRIVDGDHEIDAKVDGVGLLLKACFLKKA